MRKLTLLLSVIAVVLAISAFVPQEAQAQNMNKLIKLKKLAALAILLKGKKKFIFPLPLPLPLPIPIFKKTQKVVQSWPEPAWSPPIAEPWPAPEASWW